LWLQNTLLGTVATTVAVICVATVGLMMLSGRIDLRRGGSVVVGCFILFGASSIAAGIQGFAAGAPTSADPVLQVEPWAAPAPPVQAPLPLASPPDPYGLAPPAAPADPYAGAAVPAR
jgi:hypothetical protein